ncbi:MAG: M20 family metallo-hydrolase [Paludibacteraceae bacterium]|nr:M20 family metallo-hydrolase [Paludibacteraceae bacterium]
MSSLLTDATELLDSLIRIPSYSREEHQTAALLQQTLQGYGLHGVCRLHNNVYVRAAAWDDRHPVLLLNAHHDTVRPSAGYSNPPHEPIHRDGRIYGLGSNDDGASVVALTAAFRHFYQTPLPFNLLLAISAEEEVTGSNGMRALWPELGRVDMALVGEPTGMQAATGERGLLVLDCLAHGKRGHAARNEGINALYRAVDDISHLRSHKFDRVSELLGDIKITTTMIQAGTQHNVIPDECRFVVDVRTTDAYTNEQTLQIIKSIINSDVSARSTHIRASAIDRSHPLVQAAVATGRGLYVSPTTSDMSVIPVPSLKMGPGESSRSHSADEYVTLDEIEQGIQLYIQYLNTLSKYVTME